jgi:hypothetical protein
MFSKKATKFDEIFTVDLTLCVKLTVKILSIFVAFLENMNFTYLVVINWSYDWHSVTPNNQTDARLAFYYILWIDLTHYFKMGQTKPDVKTQVWKGRVYASALTYSNCK